MGLVGSAWAGEIVTSEHAAVLTDAQASCEVAALCDSAVFS